ncbi:hypothetical protein K502DRAFT_286635 [Neoconidiobolus thromboides FSU 785]|nr:hypothetical protein K502DRAFT_286635 [Neoconidiobolus thromboides FSU 785]
MSANINQSVETYLSLKGIQGHFRGGDHNPKVDSFGEAKHEALKNIQEHYGKPGQNAVDILKALGEPDRKEIHIPELAREEEAQGNRDHGRIAGGQMAPVMPNLGPFMGADGYDSNTAGDQYYLIYEWRGKHDYVYFKVDSNTDKVTKSGWYNALD